MVHVFYRRHFLLLAGLGAWLALITRLHLLGNFNSSFAVYGAFHASALVLSLRAAEPIWRQCLFIAVAAGLCVMALHIGMFGMQWAGKHSDTIGLYTVLGFSAWIGAVTYGVSIRLFGFLQLTPGMLAVISCSCLIATCAGWFTLGYFQSPERWWLPVLWWFALSGGLWYCDRQRRGQGLSGERTCSGRTPIPKN